MRGETRFSYFPQIQMTDIWPLFLWCMGEILMKYWQHLVNIWLIYDWYSLNVSFRYDLGTVLAKVRGGTTVLNIFLIFPNFGRGGWGSSNCQVQHHFNLNLTELHLVLLLSYLATHPPPTWPKKYFKSPNFGSNFG